MRDENWHERRQLQRFSVKASATVQSLSSGSREVFELSTRDVSSGGAFFPMEVPLQSGEKVRITLFISISPLRKESKIETDGEVIRSGPDGIAVQFEGPYSISPAPPTRS